TQHRLLDRGVAGVERLLKLGDALDRQPVGRVVGGDVWHLGRVLGRDPTEPAPAEVDDVCQVLADAEAADTVAMVEVLQRHGVEQGAGDTLVAVERLEQYLQLWGAGHRVYPLGCSGRRYPSRAAWCGPAHGAR